jgi:hypothetical protein
MRRVREHTIHLPLNYSDGEPIEPEKIKRVREDLIAFFASFVVPNEKSWRNEGVRCAGDHEVRNPHNRQ